MKINFIIAFLLFSGVAFADTIYVGQDHDTYQFQTTTTSTNVVPKVNYNADTEMLRQHIADLQLQIDKAQADLDQREAVMSGQVPEGESVEETVSAIKNPVIKVPTQQIDTGIYK